MNWRERLQARIKECGTNMKMLSQAIGKNDAFIRDVVKKGSTPNVDTFAKICIELDVSTDWLLYGENTPTSANERVDIDTLKSVIEGVDLGLAGINTSLPTDAKAEMIARLYVEARARGDLQPGMVAGALAMVSPR